MDASVDGWRGGWMDEWMDEWMDGRMDGWMDGWTDGRMDGWTRRCKSAVKACRDAGTHGKEVVYKGQGT